MRTSAQTLHSDENATSGSGVPENDTAAVDTAPSGTPEGPGGRPKGLGGRPEVTSGTPKAPPGTPEPTAGGAEGRDGEERQSAWRVLKEPSFRWYFAGAVCSNLGTWLQNTAQMLLAYRMTGSVMAVGIVTCAQFSSVLVLGPWAGMLTDRVRDRRRLLTVTQLLSACVAGGMAILYSTGHMRSGRMGEGLLIVGALLIGLSYTFSLPVFNAVVPMLVKKENVKAAMAMNTVSYNVGRAIAPILGVGVVAFIGIGWAFALNAFSFLVLAAALYVVRDRSFAGSIEHSGLLRGFKIAWEDRRILVLLLTVCAATWATDPATVLGPSLAHDVFGASDFWAGCFIAALGTGNVLGAFIRTGQPTFRRAVMYVGVLGVAMSTFALMPWLWASVAVGIVAGVAALLVGASTQTLLLEYAGARQAGQVMAVWAIAFAGSKPIASVLDGFIAYELGVHWAGPFMALPALVLGLSAVAVRKLPEPSLRKIRKHLVSAKRRRYDNLTPQLHNGV